MTREELRAYQQELKGGVTEFLGPLVAYWHPKWVLSR